MAQLIIAAAGAAIGGALAPGALFLGITGAQAGWMIGSVVGSMFGPKQNSQGPRLDDLKVTGTEYGQPIPWICGAPRIAGQIWWASERRETATTEEVGGKGGGPTLTTYSYDIDVLYGLADCEAAGVTRIWLNGKLVWTVLTDADQQSRIDSENTSLWGRVTFYGGGASQLPDAVYEAAVGSDLAPGYRGRACIFVQGLQLGSSGQLPNLTFEVCTAVDTSPNISREVAVANTTIQFADLFDTGAGIPAVLAMQPAVRVGVLNGTTVYEFDIDGVLTATTTRTSEENYPDGAGSNGGGLLSYPVGILGGQPVRAMNMGLALNAAAYHLMAGWKTAGAVGIGFATSLTDGIDQTRFLGQVALCSDGVHALIMTSPTTPTSGGSIIDRWHLISFDGTTVTNISEGTIASPITINTFGFGNSTTYHFGCCILEDDLLHLWWAYGAGDGNVSMYKIEDDDVLRLRSKLESGQGLQQRSFTQPSIWAEAGYCVAFSRQSFQAFARSGSSPKVVPIEDAVAAICARAGLTTSQYSTTELATTDKAVRGIVAAQSHSGRVLLEQLQAAYFFEASLSDKLYFRPRAAAAVATIHFADLAAGNETAGEQPLPLTLSGDLELPALVAVRYRNAYKDQETGTEYADRITASQSSLTTLDLALVLTPSEAKAVAQSASADSQSGSVSTEIALPMAYAHLEPADVVEVVDEDGESSFRLRLVRRTDEAGVLKFEAVVDDAQVVEVTGATDNTDNSSTTVRALATTEFYALDIPILRDADEGVGYYVAARGISENWPGCQIMSSENGVDYVVAANIAESAVLGVCTTTLGNWTGGWMFDEVNSITVSVAHGELSSVTRDALLQSSTANVALVGDEIIRFLSAELLSSAPNVYKLTRLLRGQRGTEGEMASHQSNERFVLLRSQGLRRIAQGANEVGNTRYLKAVTLGSSAADATPSEFINTDIGGRPFAPVNLRAVRTGAGDIAFTWDRRTRLLSYSFFGALGAVSPLGESSEAYHVSVYPTSAYGVPTYARDATTRQSPYTVDEQLLDWQANPFTLGIYFMRVRQIGRIDGPLADEDIPISTYTFTTGGGASRKRIRALFWRDAYSGETRFADALPEPASISDGASLVRATTSHAPGGRWLAAFGPNPLGPLPAEALRLGAGPFTEVASEESYASAVCYDAVEDDYIQLISAANYTQYEELRIAPDGTVSSNGNITVDDAPFQFGTPLLFQFDGVMLAFEIGTGFARCMRRDPVYPAWTMLPADTFELSSGYTRSVVGVGQLSPGGTDTLFVLVLSVDTSSTPQGNYLTVYSSTDGEAFSLVTTALIAADAVLVPSTIGNRLHKVGSVLAFYYVGGVWLSDAAGTTWTKTETTLDGSATSALQAVVSNDLGVFARVLIDSGYITSTAKLVFSSNGYAFSSAGDASVAVSGFDGGGLAYGLPSQALYGDVRRPIVASGSEVLFERSLAFGSGFSTDTLNHASSPTLGAGDWALIQRRSDSGIGMFAVRPGGAAFITTIVSPLYLLGQFGMYAVDADSGRFVAYLRATANPEGLRKLIVGTPYDITHTDNASTAFMPTDPPAGIAWAVNKFILITVSGQVYHSTTGATWVSQGPMSSGAPTFDPSPASFNGAYMRMIAGVLVMRYGTDVYYNTAADGIAWAPCTGAVASLPLATYTNGFQLYSFEASASGDVGVIVGHGLTGSNQLGGVIYYTTDGIEWTELFNDDIAAPAWGSRSTSFNYGMCWHNDNFLTDLYPITGGSNSESVIPIDTAGGDSVTYNVRAALGVATTTGIVSVGNGTIGFLTDKVYSSADGETWTELEWSDQ